MPRFIFWLQFIVVLWHWAGIGNPSVRAVPVIIKNPIKKEGLYSSQDDVIILNKNNMEDRVYGKSKVWMIEFYNSWCGHCIKFAPTWRQFASDLRGWRRVVSVGAVDCANDDNLEICRDFDIEAYPSILVCLTLSVF
ncbi:hypothetical protein V1264_006805 [Littorina saxatilis]|uniref:Thioredoxin domain-containing protein n=1 Tax=Littorina saxatilis TaxID=31220 RepID=A0AAN9AYA7_9CAEN